MPLGFPCLQNQRVVRLDCCGVAIKRVGWPAFSEAAVAFFLERERLGRRTQQGLRLLALLVRLEEPSDILVESKRFQRLASDGGVRCWRQRS